VFWPSTRGTGGANPGASKDLAQVLFVEPMISTKFQAKDSHWSPIGALPVEFTPDGLKPGTPAGSNDFTGGGLLLDTPIDPADAHAAELAIQPPAAASDAVVQIFLTDDPTVDPQRASTPHEVVLQVRGSRATLLSANGLQVADASLPGEGNSINFRIVFDATRMIVSMNDQPLFDGDHNLVADKSRRLGVRFLTKSGANTGVPVVTSCTVKMPVQPHD
jgi:hypothetical protein